MMISVQAHTDPQHCQTPKEVCQHNTGLWEQQIAERVACYELLTLYHYHDARGVSLADPQTLHSCDDRRRNLSSSKHLVLPVSVSK